MLRHSGTGYQKQCEFLWDYKTTPSLEMLFIQPIGCLLCTRNYRNFWEHDGKEIKCDSCSHEMGSLVRRSDINEIKFPKLKKNVHLEKQNDMEAFTRKI